MQLKKLVYGSWKGVERPCLEPANSVADRPVAG